MSDLLCLGELLVDFVPTVGERRLSEVAIFRRAAGGAPANVAAGFSRLGGTSCFIGKVGADEFGVFLRQTLIRAGVDVTYLRQTRAALTGLAFVSLRADGERDFLFYRNPAADALLEPNEVPVAEIETARIFHFGSISLIEKPARTATLQAAGQALARGKLVSFDPNVRPALWPDLSQARREILAAMEFTILLKVSHEELAFITGASAPESGASQLFARYPRLMLIAVTLGADGSVLFLRDRCLALEGFKVQAMDTTGAGDGFTAGLLYSLTEKMRESGAVDWSWPDECWSAIGRFANAVGALVVTKRGGIPAMPTRRAVKEFLRQRTGK